MMRKRLIILVFFIPCVAIGAVELIYYTLRWVVTGRNFGHPILEKLIFPKLP